MGKNYYILLRICMITALTIVQSGCATYEPEVLTPITNLDEFYQQCRNSEGISPTSQGSLSYSDRYYCLGYVQAMSEATIYWRKKKMDINSGCHVTVSDFYHQFVKDIEYGYFARETSVANAFRKLSYQLCPQIQYINKNNI